MEEIIVCAGCNYKCVKSQLYKTKGMCPVCKTQMSLSVVNDTKVEVVA